MHGRLRLLRQSALRETISLARSCLPLAGTPRGALGGCSWGARAGAGRALALAVPPRSGLEPPF